jgi:alpha-galactosidase
VTAATSRPATAPGPARHAAGSRAIDTIRWGNPDLTLELRATASEPVAVRALEVAGRRFEIPHPLPLVEVVTVGAGHVPASDRLVGTAIGADLRVSSHSTTRAGGNAGHLDVVLDAARYGVRADVRLSTRGDTSAVRVVTTITNVGSEPVVLRSVTSWVSGLGGPTVPGNPLGDWTLVSGTSDWLAEGRWTRQPLTDLLPGLDEALTGHNPRGSHRQASGGTWSTGRSLPMGILESKALGLAWMWQVEHNGAWRWEVGQDTDGPWFAACGPTDADAHWTRVLGPGDSFTTVPVSVAVGTDAESAVAAMTSHRRDLRRPHPDNDGMGVVFNDYMNTLDGDPTTASLLPLIEAAGAVGAEIFCIDAGWYDDSGDWWESVGEWRPSAVRFPDGLGEVIDHIRRHGMTPGLWLEPEVVGVRSPVADRLPDLAYFTRHGQRLVEHDRYHLDLRHPAAVAHLDEVVDRLVAEFGIGFFKFDYNIDPASGPDADADSPGDGLLQHNRAHLRWLDSVLDRHPDLVVENCSSGAMRMDPALLSRLAMQSTSDQQEFSRLPPIAASAPLALLPEQAASWAYPQPGMSDEEIAFCLVTGLLGRFYLSGFLNRMEPGELALVAQAVETAKLLRKELPHTRPLWPTGLPGWEDPWVSLALDGPEGILLSVWRRGGDPECRLHLPHLLGVEVEIRTLFPVDLPAWSVDWSPQEATLTVLDVPHRVSARTFRIQPATARPGPAPSSDRSAAPGGPIEGEQ